MKRGEVSTLVWKDFISSPVGIVLNGFMNTVPGFNGSWVALQQAIEQTKSMRILRALDLLELFSDEDFQRQFLESEQALDGFGLCYEGIIRERNKEKRQAIKNIFVGFNELSEEEKGKLEIEKILFTLSIIGFEELKILKEIISSEQNPILFSQSSMGYGKGFKTNKFDIYKHLEALGIITIHIEIDSIEREIIEGDSEESFGTGNYETDVGTTMHYEVTTFGCNFISYVLE